MVVWRSWVSAGTGWPGVSIPWLGETACMCGTSVSGVEACTVVVESDLSLRYACKLLGR